MKKFMLLVSTALLAACGGDDEQKTVAANPVQSNNQQAQILSYIPAESPLLITTGLNPDAYPKRYIEVMQNNMDSAVKYMEVVMQQAMGEVVSKYDDISADDESTDSEAYENAVNEKQAKKEQIMAFVDNWLVDGHFSKVGFKVGETQLAVYLVDLFPVIRIKLSNGNQIEVMLNDIQQQFEVPFVISDLEGVKVREVVADQMTLMIATQDDYLVLSVAPTVIKDQLINQLLGVQKPSQSLADDFSKMNQIKQTHQYINDDLMLIDFQALADYFIYPDKHNSALVNFLQIDENMLSAVCKSEISDMIAKAPRMVAGSKALTNDTIKGSFIWEMNQAVAQDLATMAGRIPHGNKDAAFAFGMSFDLKNARDVTAKYVNQLVESPYQCEHFAQFNQQATDLQAKLSQPIPPFVGNFKGFNFSLDDLKLDLVNADLANPNPKEIIKSLKTQLFLSVDETEALLGMAQMMVPQLQDIEVKTDGSLITLADKVPMISGKDIPLDISNLYAAISADTIGFSMGHEGGGDLSDKVSAPGKTAMMSFSANAEGYKNILEQVFSMAEMPDMPEDIKKQLAQQKELTLGMLYWKTQDVSLGFSDQGFETDFTINY